MQRNSLYIVYAGLWLGLTSMVYFLSLVLKLPFVIAVLLTLLSCAGLWWTSLRYMPESVYRLSRAEQRIAMAGMLFALAAGTFLARKYGDWDAVYIYNLASRFLQDPEHWQQLFLYRDRFSHADYPLQVPASVAFLQRLSGGTYQEWVPFVIALFYMVAIPLLIFFETVASHRILAVTVLVTILGNTYYLNNGVIQCADVPLSFYLLLAFVSIQRYREQQENTIWILLYGMALGLCAWTKNEGLLYAVVLLLSHARELRRHIGCLLWGILPPLLVWALFKGLYAPANDMVSGLSGQGFGSRFLDKERYKLIAAAYTRYAGAYFYTPGLALIAYVFLCIYRHTVPHRDLLPFLGFALAMTGVYLCTYHDLAWHLENSLSRILLQWYPAFWFVLATRLAQLMPAQDPPSAARG